MKLPRNGVCVNAIRHTPSPKRSEWTVITVSPMGANAQLVPPERFRQLLAIERAAMAYTKAWWQSAYKANEKFDDLEAALRGKKGK